MSEPPPAPAIPNMPKKKDPNLRKVQEQTAGQGQFFDSGAYEVKKQLADPAKQAQLKEDAMQKTKVLGVNDLQKNLKKK